MKQSAAVLVLDHTPSDDEMEDLAYYHLESSDIDEATATFEILTAAPDWMSVCERDQINAHMRDIPGAICFVIYMMEGELVEDDMDDDEEI